MAEYVETIIVGGGQAGLATGFGLAQRGREYLILEQADRPGSAWRDGRWDSFTLVTPNWMTRLPGAEYSDDDPDGFLPTKGILSYFDAYADRRRLALRYHTQVRSVELDGGRYHVATHNGGYVANNVVIATGMFQQPRVPAYASDFPPGIRQLHSSAYRKPEALPPGAVLVAGSAQSGCQITEELYQSGRKVYLCVGSAPRAPRRYRGKDTTWWLVQVGFFDQTVDQLPNPRARYMAPPQLTGKDGGHTLNLHQFAREGVVLLGRIVGIEDGKSRLAPDLRDNLARGDQFEAQLVKRIDTYIEVRGLQAPEEELPHLQDGYAAPLITELDLQAAGISTVIWATGYTFSFDLVKLPVCDADRFPIQKSGVTQYPGLYFVGLPYLPWLKTAFLYGVGENTEYVASQIAARPA